MKRKLVALMMCAMVTATSLTLVACGDSAEDTAAVAEEEETDEEEAYEEEYDDEEVDEEEVEEDEVEEDEADEAAESEDTADASAIASILTDCYAGITDDENTYAYIGFGDNIAALLFLDSTTKESGSFVGAYEQNDNAITITDEDLGVTMTFTVEEYEDGFKLDMGEEIGVAYVAPVSNDDFAAAMVAINQGSEPQF